MSSQSPTFAASAPRAMPRLSGRRWTLIAVALATFMTYLDNNIINVAIPTIERSLHLSQSGMEWVVSGYILTFAGLLLAGGRLADVFGQKRLFMVGLSIFTGASLLAGLVGQVDLLIASRALQGLGAALLTPTTLAILSTAYPEPREQARAVGAWSAVGAVALAVGPLLGGVLSQDVNWHWIFFINVPVGAPSRAPPVFGSDAGERARGSTPIGSKPSSVRRSTWTPTRDRPAISRRPFAPWDACADTNAESREL
jgi:MFS family permease